MADPQSPILCPFCAQGYAWRYDAGNKRVICKCGAIFRVPLNSFSACELIAKPGDNLSPHEAATDEMTIQEDPIEPLGYLEELTLAPDPDEALFTEQEAPDTPASDTQVHTPTPESKNLPRRRPQIIPFDEAPPAIYQDRSPSPPAAKTKPTPRPQAALTDKPAQKTSVEAARDAFEKPAVVALVCPHCQGELPGNAPTDICPHCKSVIAPLRENEVQASVQKTLDDPLMAILRKRGMEQVVQTVAREAAEREALNKKHERERNVYDVYVPAIASAFSLFALLVVTLLGLRYQSFSYILAHEFVWIILLSLPASLASMWVGQNILDADFHLDRILFIKVSAIALVPYSMGLLVVPGAFDMKNTLAYISLLVMVIGIYTLMIGLVYRLSLAQAAIMAGVYGMLMVLFTSTSANQIIKLILWPLGK